MAILCPSLPNSLFLEPKIALILYLRRTEEKLYINLPVAPSLNLWMAFHSLQGQVLNSLCLGDSVFIKPVPCCCNFRSCHAPIPATRDISSPPGSQTGLLPLPGPSLRKSMCLGWTGRGREKIPGKTKPSRAALSLHTFRGCLACGSLQLHL